MACRRSPSGTAPTPPVLALRELGASAPYGHAGVPHAGAAVNDCEGRHVAALLLEHGDRCCTAVDTCGRCEPQHDVPTDAGGELTRGAHVPACGRATAEGHDHRRRVRACAGCSRDSR